MIIMNNKKILFIQFRTDKSKIEEQKSILRFIRNKKEIKIINAFNNHSILQKPELIIKNYSKVILGGSGQYCFSKHLNQNSFKEMLKRIKPLIKYILKNNISTLGICFGHQLLGYFFGSEIIDDKKQSEVGTYKVFINKNGQEETLFDSIPLKFMAQLGHKDSIKKLPKNCILLAKSSKCKIQSFKYKDNVYGVQFHPELTKKDVIKKIKMYPSYTKNKKSVIKKIHSTPFAKKVIQNFLYKI